MSAHRLGAVGREWRLEIPDRRTGTIRGTTKDRRPGTAEDALRAVLGEVGIRAGRDAGYEDLADGVVEFNFLLDRSQRARCIDALAQDSKDRPWGPAGLEILRS